jgi:hypothetical protein
VWHDEFFARAKIGSACHSQNLRRTYAQDNLLEIHIVKIRDDLSQSIVFATRVPTADRRSFANDGQHFFRRAVSILIAIEQNRAGSGAGRKRQILPAEYKTSRGREPAARTVPAAVMPCRRFLRVMAMGGVLFLKESLLSFRL